MRHPFLDAHEIIPNLWQGSLPPSGEVLRSAGFQALVLCAREIQPPDSNFPGVTVIHAPNDDHSLFPLNRTKLRMALKAARRVVELIQDGHQVLVTCAAGLNRSGLVSALALHLHFGWTGADCVDFVRAKRPTSRARPGLRALGNSEFVQVLNRLPAIPA